MSVTGTLPPDAMCLLLVIDGNEYSFAVEPCDTNMYALCCKYTFFKHFILGFKFLVLYKNHVKRAIKNGQSRDTGNNWHTRYRTKTNKTQHRQRSNRSSFKNYGRTQVLSKGKQVLFLKKHRRFIQIYSNVPQK